MGFEQPPEQPPEKSQERPISYYSYENPDDLKEVQDFESQLGDDPEELIRMRADLEAASDELHFGENQPERTKQEKRDLYHKNLDKAHAINRKLNRLNYKE